MSDAPTTRASLLVRLRDAKDATAWQDFVLLYSPLVKRFALRRGLQDADAADLVQDVLHAVSTGAERLEYDSQRGTFRGWLLTIAHRKFCNLLTRQQRPGRGSGDSDMQQLLNEHPDREDSDVWERDYQQAVFAWAAERVRPTISPSTWQAFWETAVEGCSGQEVADKLGLTAAAVYLAKSRITLRIKEQVALWDSH
jgi:RNA polymerase sigma factor (sigma-70 family)